MSTLGKHWTDETKTKARNITFDLTIHQFKKFWQIPCNYCGSEIFTIGLDRVESSIGYRVDNVVSCCKMCNYWKRDFPSEVFIEHCQKIVRNAKLIQ